MVSRKAARTCKPLLTGQGWLHAEAYVPASHSPPSAPPHPPLPSPPPSSHPLAEEHIRA